MLKRGVMLLLSAMSIMATGWFVLGMLLLTVIVDYKQSQNDNFGWSVFFTLITAACAYLLIKPSGTALLLTLVCWIPVGIAWSMFKWKLRISKTKYVINTEKLKPDSSEYKRLRRRLDIDTVKSTVAYWVVFFPISMMSTCLFNIFESIEYLVTVKLGGTFRRMAAEAFK